MLAEPRPSGVVAALRGRFAAAGHPVIGPAGWLLAVITAVGALLRFASITTQSFWVDEATTVHEVGLSFGQMLHELRLNETTPPLYFAVAWVWTRVFGAGELGIRSLSALAGIVLIPVVYLCGRELVSRAAGLVAAALAATSPFMIWYSQEARAYMLFALLGAVSFLAAARLHRTGARRDLVLWAVSSALAVLTHFFAGFLVAPEALWLLWHRRGRETVVACVAIAAIQLAVLPLAIGDTSHPLNWLTQFPLSTRIADTPTDFAVSTLYLSGSGLASEGLLGAGLLAAITGALLWRGGGPRERRGAGLAAALAACVLLVPVVLAWVGHDYVYNRNFIPAWIPLAVVLGAACTAPRAQPLGAGLAVVLVVLFVWANAKISADAWLQRPDWRGAAAALGPVAGERAIVAQDGNSAEQPLAVYLPGTRFSYLGSPSASPAVTVSELDVVGDPALAVTTPLPAGVRLIAAKVVSVKIEVWRFALTPAWHRSTDAIAAAADALFGGSIPTPSVLLQR